MAFQQLQHPLIEHELGTLRQKDCPPHLFRQSVRRIAMLMTPFLTQEFASILKEIETPLEKVDCQFLQAPIVLVPILRAGLGFLDGFLDVIPQASVAHIGLRRNETTLQPQTYYTNLPSNIGDCEIILLDPMLATGGSAIAAVKQLRSAGAQRIRFACLVAAPEGVECFMNECPDVPVFTAALDRCLNERGYILPGLGDAGDRLFGT